MPSTYTLNNGIELIATGEQSGTWGDTTNTNLSLIDTALDGQVTVTLASAGTSGSPNTLPISDGSASNGRNRLVIFDDGGDLGATAYVQLTPNDAEKIVYVRNDLSGSRSIILFQGTYNASNDYEVPAGTTAVVFFDGGGAGAVAANVFNNAFFDSLRLGSVSVTAILDEDNMASDSDTALATQQSIKAYVDAQVTAQDLDFAGDSGTGAVDLDSQSLTIAGTTNEIETSASGQTLTVGLPSAVIVTTSVTTPTVQATNLNANDGTTAATIADSTGVVTVNSAILTTADINGGTADNVVIGGATPAAGSFTTVGATGNITSQGQVITDTINEQTATSGVTVDGVLLKDGGVTLATGGAVNAILDEDNMASDSDTALATQQSIKAYVDAQVTAQDLDFAGDSGTGAVDLDSQTFTVAGTTNQITTAASGQTVTVSLPATIATTTADLTNLEVTNIKAKDGTASATIADSTGVMTIASSVLTTTDINGGTIDGVTLGTNSAVTEAQIDNLNLNGNAITSTNTNGDIDLTPNGSGEVNITKVDIDGGTIDGTVIGGGTAAAGTFTNVTANGTINFTGATVSNGGTVTTVDIDGGTIDGTTQATGTINGPIAAGGTWTAAATWTLPAFTLGGTVTSNGQSFSGTIANLGTVTTVDINGGTIDGTTIGGATAAAGTFTNMTANTDLTINATTTVTAILDEDNMASDSDTALATQQSIKAYVDAQVGANNELSEVLANGNTSGGTNIQMTTTDEVQFRDTALKISSSVDGQLDLDADVELEITAPTLDIDASTAVTIDTATFTVTGSANVVGDLDVDNININGNAITSTDTNGNIALTPDGTGEVDISKVDIDGGTIDGTVIGGSTPAAISGTSISGTSFASTGNMTFGDNDKAIFGAGSNLSIYTDGNTSFIQETGAGNFAIDGTNIFIRNGAGTANMASFVDGGAASLYHNSTARLATTSTGVDVTGTVTADGLTVESTGQAAALFRGYTSVTGVNSANNGEILLGNNTNFQGRISYEGQSVGVLYVENSYNNDAANILFRSKSAGTAQNKLLIEGNGDISFYEDLGVTPKFFWDASTERLGIGNAAPTTTLDVTGTVTADGLTVESATGAIAKIGRSDTAIALNDVLGQLDFTTNDASTTEPIRGQVKVISDGTSGNSSLYISTASSNTLSNRIKVGFDGDISFYEDTGTTPKFFWDASAERLGLGTASPATMLDLSSNNNAGTAINILQFTDTDTGALGGQPIGTVQWYSSDNSAAGVVATLSVNNQAGSVGNMYFSTGGLGAAPTQRMQINYLGDISFYEDTGTTAKFFWDASAESLGIGTSSPSSFSSAAQDLVVGSTTGSHGITIQSQNVSNGNIYFTDTTGTNYNGFVRYYHGDNALAFGTNDGTERMRIDSSGNLLLGGTITPASATDSLAIFNGTAPTGSVTDGVVLYAEDVSSSSELKVRDEAGNVTTLSPHNFDLIPEGPSEDMAWSYYSERDGKRINVDMLKAIRILEQLSGEKLVHMV